MLPYTIEEITRRITPIAQEYRLTAVYVFGSYARGEATAESDIDLLVDLSGSNVDTLFVLSILYEAFENALETQIDLITTSSLEQPTDRRSERRFNDMVKRERKIIYGAA